MCYELPGPRCSPHARARLEKLEEKREELRGSVQSLTFQLQDAVAEYRNDPSSKSQANKIRSLRKKISQDKKRIVDASAKIKAAQMEYDGTPEGQKELQEGIDSLDKIHGSSVEFKELDRRLGKGKAKNAWRRNQLSLKREESKSNKTLKERRGKFITLMDRDGSEEVVEERDLYLSAA